jgi:cobalt-zinc-cadmium efflux system membrane fusion protein
MRSQPIFLIAALAIAGLQCDRNETPVSDHEEPVISEAPPADDVVHLSDASVELVGIQTEKAKSEQCVCVLKAMGKVLAPQPQTAIVSHAFPGRVARVHVKIGDWVDQGQPVIDLDSQDVGEAKSGFYKATANCELAKLNYEREERLSASGIGVKKNLLAAEAEYKVAQAEVEAAHKRLHILGFTEDQVKGIAETHQINPTITLDAPIAGKVVDIEAVRGAMVDQSTEILTIIDPTLLWVDAEIYEKDLAKVKIGQRVEIVVPAYPGEIFAGKLSYIGDLVNEETRTITVRAEVGNDDQRLKPGMFADVKILLNGGEQMLVVPLAAVLEEGSEKIVFVRENDRFARRQIQTGIVDGDYQQVVSGLEPGEEVVIEGNHELKSKLQEDILRAAEVH